MASCSSTLFNSVESPSCVSRNSRVVISTDPWSPGRYRRTSYAPVSPPCSASWSTLSRTRSQSMLSGRESQPNTSATMILRSSSLFKTAFLLFSAIWLSGILAAQLARLCLSRSSDLPSSQNTELNAAWCRRAKSAASCVFPIPPSPYKTNIRRCISCERRRGRRHSSSSTVTDGRATKRFDTGTPCRLNGVRYGP